MEVETDSPGLSQTSRNWAPQATVLAIGVAWSAWFTYLAVTSWDGYWFGVFDVGIFDQGTWLLSRFQEPFVTVRGLHLFGDHASYILLLVAPIYWVIADINVLVVIAAIVPAVAAWLSFRIGVVEGLNPWTAVVVAIAFLFHPAVAWVPWDSFHPEVFALALLPGAYLAARTNRPILFVVLGFLVALVKEDAFLVLIPLAIYVGWKWDRHRLYAIGVGLMAAGVAVFNFGVLLPEFSPTGELIYTGRYSFNPIDWITASRFEYLAAMLLPLPIVFRAPLLLAVAGPITAANLASGFTYQHEIRWHYTVYLLGVMAAAAPVGMAKLVERWGPDVGVGMVSERRRLALPLSVLLYAIAVTSLLLLGPDLRNEGVWGGWTTEQQDEVSAAFELIPDDAVVAASHTFAPHLAHRKEIYMLPNPWVADAWGVAPDTPPRPDPSVVEWIFTNLESAGESERRVVEEAEGNGWTEVLSGDKWRLLKADHLP